MIKAKVSTDYKDIERIFAGGSIQKEIIKVWSTEANDYVFEAWRVLETEGPLPLTLNANGEPLIDYRIYGNTEQTGTPTPENPIMPIGVGEKTENLWSADKVRQIQVISDASIVRYGIAFSGSAFSFRLISNSIMYYKIKTGDTYGDATQLSVDVARAITITDNQTLLVYGENQALVKQAVIQINSGATILPYEPYGYKLPILSNSTVTNIYLGEVQTTRRIKKLVFNGTEGWLRQEPAHTTCINFYLPVNNAYPNSVIISNAVTYNAIAGVHNDTIVNVGKINNLGQNLLVDLSLSDFANVTAWKTYLQQQYAAGTPVTVWYVLAEPETGIVNEPLMKIWDYADTVDSTQTNVQIPTFKGATVIDYDGGEKHFITSDGYVLVDKNQNGFLLSGSTGTLYPDKMYIKYKGR